MTFNVTCDGVRLDEAALIRSLYREPVKRMNVDMILKLAEGPNFDSFLAGDHEFVRASAKLADAAHRGATRREGLIAMDAWMEAVESTALVIWKPKGSPREDQWQTT